MIIGIDLDGTLCSEERTFERPLAKPIDGSAQSLKRLKEEGWTIVIWTARGWEQYRVTERWLQDNDMTYDQLLMGKPQFQFLVDDRAVGFTGWDAAMEKISRTTE